MQYMPSGKVGQGAVGGEIERHSVARPNQPAVICTGYAPLSYRELQSLISEIRKDLRGAGLSRTARIAIALPNGPHAALAIVAVACSAVAVPLNPKQTLPEMEKCLAVLGLNAILLFRGEDSAARQAATLKGLAIIEATRSEDGTLGFSIVESPVGANAAHEEPDEPDPNAPAFILQTSGTTAESKLVPTSHSNMIASAARVQAWFKLTPQDRCLSVSPVYYAHGLHVTAFTPLLTGGSIAFPTDASKFDYSEWFSTLRPTWYSAGPTLHRLVFDQVKSRADAKTEHSLRFILSGGAPLPLDVSEGLQKTLGVPVVEHYGSSEGMQICSNVPGRSKPGTCGVPWPGVIRIVDEVGHQLPQGVQGEVLVGGPTLTSGYLDAPELNREYFIDGWFKTGDIGSIDDEGFLTLHGRLKDLINRGGEKISPVEIDDALLRHPAVAEAAAFAMPHARLGEDVAAAVVLRPGMTATPLELRSYLTELLASFKVPRRIIIADQLPKGSTGKVLRRQLSETFGTQSVVSAAAADKSVDNSLLLQLRDLWEKHLNCGPLTIDDDFFEKGGDSLLAMEVLSEIERLTGQPVPNTSLFDFPTIRELERELHKQDKLQQKLLVQMSANGDKPPLVLFHGDSGGGHYVTKLASLLGPEQPLFVVTPHGLDNTPVPPSIEAMAADRLPLIRSVLPHGPYRLGGYCMGGLVAFEAARMLIAAGETVEIVVMIDSPTMNARPIVQVPFSILNRVRPIGGSVVEFIIGQVWFGVQLATSRSESLLKRSPADRWPKIKDKMAAFAVGSARMLGLTQRAKEAKPAWLASVDRFTRAYSIPASRYLPKPLSVRVVYFSAAFTGNPWRRISSNLEIVNVSGDHYAIVRDCTELADNLRSLLQEKLV
jgi:acyl-CoA synthetase (AMP-forming)/AMP-acid ligase II/thioesterase domain-containing protein